MNSKFTIFSIATNEYVSYWMQMIESVSKNCLNFNQIQFILCTNNINTIEDFKKKMKFDNISCFETQHLPWPLVTLSRYHFIKNVLKEVKGDVFIYLDADMLITKDFLQEINSMNLTNKMYFVPHPGFVFNYLELNILKKFKNKFLILLGNKRYGSWERNKYSKAFVKRVKRKIYLCGGIWFGDTKKVKIFINDLIKDTEYDLKNNIIPKWHDESYLNCWATKNSFELASPAFCFDHRYLAKYNIEPIIVAINKHETNA